MTEHLPDPESGDGKPNTPQKPLSARDGSEGRKKPPSVRGHGAAQSGDKKRGGGRGRRGKGRARKGKPTPARSMAGGEGAPPVVPADVPEVVVEVDGCAWTVKVLGRAGGGTAREATPLLLLGFSEVEGESVDSTREALVVGRTLGGLTAPHLEEAFARSTPRGS